jgi:hypothetical protein
MKIMMNNKKNSNFDLRSDQMGNFLRYDKNSKNAINSKNSSVLEVLRLTSPIPMSKPASKPASKPTSKPESTQKKVNTDNANRILHLAEIFNQVSGSERPLIPDYYDCGTTARAIFIHLINYHRRLKIPSGVNNYYHLYPSEIEAIYFDYRPESPESPVSPESPGRPVGPTNTRNPTGPLKKLDDAIYILNNMKDGVMILTVRFWYCKGCKDCKDSKTDYDINEYGDHGPSRILTERPSKKQFGHVWIIEKKNNSYYIYQSSLNEYTTYDYYSMFGANLKEGGPNFLESLRPLIQIKNWSPKHERIFENKFWFVPNIPIGTSLCPEFFYAYVEYN